MLEINPENYTKAAEDVFQELQRATLEKNSSGIHVYNL